jgi:hypothetical protein
MKKESYLSPLYNILSTTTKTSFFLISSGLFSGLGVSGSFCCCLMSGFFSGSALLTFANSLSFFSSSSSLRDFFLKTEYLIHQV